MTRIASPAEAVQRFCKLREEVASHMANATASDCICGQGGYWPEGTTIEHALARPPLASWRDDGVVMEFIENAVRAAIAGTPVQQDARNELIECRETLDRLITKVSP